MSHRKLDRYLNELKELADLRAKQEIARREQERKCDQAAEAVDACEWVNRKSDTDEPLRRWHAVKLATLTGQIYRLLSKRHSHSIRVCLKHSNCGIEVSNIDGDLGPAGPAPYGVCTLYADGIRQRKYRGQVVGRWTPVAELHREWQKACALVPQFAAVHECLLAIDEDEDTFETLGEPTRKDYRSDRKYAEWQRKLKQKTKSSSDKFG